MNTKNIINKVFLSAFLIGSGFLASCTDDLNTEPIDNGVLTSEKAWRQEATYTEFLAKNYAGLTLSGNEGPSGEGDLNNGDQGVATFTRGLWNLQEMPTDEALCVWNDDGLRPLQFNEWSSQNNYCYQFFQRAMLNIAYANEYLRETTEDKLSTRGMTHLSDDVKIYREEVRALRALNYYYLMDLYGNPPMITENDPIGGTVYPGQIKRADLYTWIESELKALEANNILPAKEYSRFSITTVRMVLAKMYLNAEVYIGTAKYKEAADYSKKIIDAYPNGLNPSYRNLFGGDNHQYSNEIIFGLPYDSQYATSYGGTTFLIAAAVSADMGSNANFGLSAAWGGVRAPEQLTRLFEKSKDKRYLFWEKDRVQEIDEWSSFTQGFSIAKFTNLKSNETVYPTPETAPPFADADWVLFRLSDVYLMYAEALVRQQSSSPDVTKYFNEVRTRAGLGGLSLSQITLDEILDERARELYWEGHRRTDLIRFGKFLSGYNWSYKGGNKAGMDINSKYLLFPIPAIELGANPNLIQNTGYTN